MSAIGGILKDLIGPILKPIIDKIPDPNARAQAAEQAETQILAAVTSLVEGQLEINKVEASSPSLFVAGWRPFVGWVCGFGFALNYIVMPLMMWGYSVWTTDASYMPDLNIGELMTVLLGMLGLGGLRTYEKRMGVSRETL